MPFSVTLAQDELAECMRLAREKSFIEIPCYEEDRHSIQ